MNQQFFLKIAQSTFIPQIYHRTYRDIEIDDRDEEGAGPESVEKVVQFIRTYLRGVATTPAIFEPCVYSVRSVAVKNLLRKLQTFLHV